jgi:hypothetical protein
MALWIAGLVGAIAVLRALGHGALAPPAVRQVRPWLATRGPYAAVAALLRLIALGLAWYLLVTTLVALGVRLLRAPGLVRAADIVTLPSVRRLAAGVAGVSLALSALSLPAPAGASPFRSPADVRRPDPGPAGETPPVMRWIAAPVDPQTRPAPTRTPQRRAPPLVDPSPPGPGVPVGDQPVWPAAWIVHRGDNLWQIASTVLATTWGRPPTNTEIAGYWLRLVDTNKTRLVFGADPSLIYPGQVFVLVAPPPT